MTLYELDYYRYYLGPWASKFSFTDSLVNGIELWDAVHNPLCYPAHFPIHSCWLSKMTMHDYTLSYRKPCLCTDVNISVILHVVLTSCMPKTKT